MYSFWCVFSSTVNVMKHTSLVENNFSIAHRCDHLVICMNNDKSTRILCCMYIQSLVHFSEHFLYKFNQMPLFSALQTSYVLLQKILNKQ